MSIRDAEYDPPEVELWLYSRSGSLAFDIGGNNGRVAALLSERFEHVVSCEPASESYEALARVPGVTSLNVAVSDASGPITLAVQSNHIETGQLSSPTGGGEEWIEDRSKGGGGWGEIIDSRVVDAVTIDDLASWYGDPDFIKCDVEGHELRVFEGAIRTLQRAQPSLYIEVHNAQLGAGLRVLLDPIYPDLRELWHPYYRPEEFGATNHYWLVADKG